MSTADKSSLPLTSRSFTQQSYSEASTISLAVRESKDCETDSSWAPELPPRTRPRQLNTSYSRDTYDGGAQGYRQDGSCGRNSPCMSSTERSRKSYSQLPTTPYQMWPKNIRSLLDDMEGVKLFTQYLKEECDSEELDKLEFCFACVGLKKQEPERIRGLVKTIYKKYFREKDLGFPAELRERLSQQISERSKNDVNNPVKIESFRSIFDEANTFMLNMINKTTYFSFLKSPLCLNYTMSLPIHDRLSCGSESSRSIPDYVDSFHASNYLGTVHEDKELVTKDHAKLPLTKDLLLRTASRRLETAPKMTFSPYHTKTAHRSYVSYNPVSSQDSDARTESDLSMTDGSVDGLPGLKFSRRTTQKSMSERPIINHDNAMCDEFIPLTKQENRPEPITTNELLLKVAAKLKMIVDTKEGEEQIKRKLESNEPMKRKVEPSDVLRPEDLKAELAKIINKDALNITEENSQDILDKHCKRVFSSDQTPTPNPKSPPRNKSPDLPNCRRSRSAFNPTLSTLPPSCFGPPPIQSNTVSSYPYSSSRSSRKKDKDGISMFSVDSGMVHDFTDGSELYPFSQPLSSQSHHLPKSKSMPDYAHSEQPKSESAFLNTGHRSSSRSNRQTGDLTDSGVSVVSDTPPVVPFKDKNRFRAGTNSGNKILAQRLGPQDSNKRLPHSMSAQQFFGDSSMPPPDVSYTVSQLNDVSRKLTESSERKVHRFRHSISNKGFEPSLPSYPSTLSKSMSAQTGLPPQDRVPYSYSSASTVIGLDEPPPHTVVIFSFCNDEVPYRTKILGNSITLRQFKDLLPKKGAFRFFFKTKCEDYEIDVIQEEISDDNEVLPMWDGKIMAQVKAIE